MGAGGHAKVVIDAVERRGQHRIVGLLDADDGGGRMVLGYSVVGPDEELAEFVGSLGVRSVLVAVGDGRLRAALVERARRLVPGLLFVGAVHPAATIGRDVSIGQGTVVMAGAVVNPGTRIGAFCVVNTQSSIDHDCALGDFASVAPNACLAGGVLVGAFAAIGVGANVAPGIRIGDGTVVGAGATVLDHLPPDVVAYGTPAVVVRAAQRDQTT
jgi:sugar O-acyltransferase (sialic acid O-acetyltransferase NeuD family)